MERLKPALALVMGAVGLVVGVIGLSSLMMGSRPSSSTTPARADTTAPVTGSSEGLPTAEGGVLTVSGTETGTLELTGLGDPSTSPSGGYTLQGRDGRLTLAGEPLDVDHLVYKALDFYLDPDDCTLTTGEVNTQIGVAAATVSCPEITDIRDTATITVEGTIGISGQLVERDDLPAEGGTITVSGALDVTYDVTRGSWATYVVGGVTPTPSPLLLSFADGEPWEVGGPEISQNEEGTELWISRLYVPPDRDIALERDDCPVGYETVATVDPRTDLRRITLDCTVTVEGVGDLTFSGSVVVSHSVIEIG